MKKQARKLLAGLLFLLPLALAVVGLTSAGEKVLDALFSGVIMYAMGYGDSPPNLLVQLARWTAPLATASGVSLLFAPLVRLLRARINLLRGRSVAVYGDPALCKALNKASFHAVAGEEKLLPAQRYVLFLEEKENLRFYLENREALRDKEVYLRCSSLRSQEIGGGRLHLFCLEEVGARLYWKQAETLELFRSRGPELRIALIGFGSLGEQLLLWGLQNNIFSPEQRIEYHVFGDGESFLALHQELGSVEDRVSFHDDWRKEAELLRQADRILVCEQTDQLLLIEELLFVLGSKELDVLAAEPEELSLLEGRDRLRVFSWKEAALLPENLFDDRTLQRAKAINLRYAHIYNGTEETPANAQAEWEKLNSFTRYSNISAADYHEIRLQMLKSWGVSTGEELGEEQLELLSELEHIRWCRFHYLNNWRFGLPESGKAKDAVRRIHSNLVPYGELTEGDKEKDRENIRTLLRISVS